MGSNQTQIDLLIESFQYVFPDHGFRLCITDPRYADFKGRDGYILYNDDERVLVINGRLDFFRVMNSVMTLLFDLVDETTLTQELINKVHARFNEIKPCHIGRMASVEQAPAKSWYGLFKLIIMYNQRIFTEFIKKLKSYFIVAFR